MKRRLILITGMPGSGKSEFISVAKGMGIQVVSMGDVIRKYAREKNVPPERIGEFADSERQKYGYDIWAERTIPFIMDNPDEWVIIEGVRGMAEVERFKKGVSPEVKIVAIQSSPEHRFERMMKRKREDDSLLKEKFNQRDQREIGWGISEVIASADHVIINDNSLEKFKKDVKMFLTGLKSEC